MQSKKTTKRRRTPVKNNKKKLLTEVKLNENVFIIFMIFMVFIVFMTYVIDSNKKEYNIKNGEVNSKEIFGEVPTNFNDYDEDNNVFSNIKISRNVYYSMVLARKLELYKNGDITKEEYLKNVKKYNSLINK
jgi:uncharacterized membrane protein